MTATSTYICDHCKREPLYLKNNHCPDCGSAVTKVIKKEPSKVIYCTHCRMWFDTKNGWNANSSKPIGQVEITTGSGKKVLTEWSGIPICPACSAPLFEIESDKFYAENEKNGRLKEVMTWEWPNGSFWKKGEHHGNQRTTSS